MKKNSIISSFTILLILVFLNFKTHAETLDESCIISILNSKF